MGEICHLILQAIEDRSNRQIERVKERFCLTKKDLQIRKTNPSRNNRRIGSLKIEPIHVDHSVPGVYGFIIYTSTGPI